MTTPSQSLLVLAGNIFNELDANKVRLVCLSFDFRKHECTQLRSLLLQDGKLTPLELSTKLSDFGFSDEKVG